MRFAIVVALAALAASSTLAAARTDSAAGATFRMPSGNIGCGQFAGSLRCDILSGLRPRPTGGCELDWTGLSLEARGRARPTCAGDTVYDPRAPVLLYGRTWRRGGITCFARRTGLRCSNRTRRGFVLARERWRTF